MRLEINHLDGRRLVSSIFMPGDYVSNGWGWVCDHIGREFECEYEEIDCVEAGDDDEDGNDRITVRGVPVCTLHWVRSC